MQNIAQILGVTYTGKFRAVNYFGLLYVFVGFIILYERGVCMSRFFIGLAFAVVMAYYYGWIACCLTAFFVILNYLLTLRESQQKALENKMEYEKKVLENCQHIYTKILDEVPAVASLIASYYNNRDKEEQNFLSEYAKVKSCNIKNNKNKE